MTYSEKVRIIQTAGTWFVGSFMGEILLNYSKICDDVEKKVSFIEHMHKEYGEALEFVLQRNDKKVFDGGKENAQAVLDSIRNGKYKLPY